MDLKGPERSIGFLRVLTGPNVTEGTLRILKDPEGS